MYFMSNSIQNTYKNFKAKILKMSGSIQFKYILQEIEFE